MSLRFIVPVTSKFVLFVPSPICKEKFGFEFIPLEKITVFVPASIVTSAVKVA